MLILHENEVIGARAVPSGQTGEVLLATMMQEFAEMVEHKGPMPKNQIRTIRWLAPVDNGWRVLFIRTGDLVQRLQVARRELALESALAKLDKYHLLILDDIAYVNKDQAESAG